MKIVIEIPEETYKECQGDIYFHDTGGDLFDAVKNGTSLPKIFEDIKAEIKELYAYDCKEGAYYLDKAIEIIDKHISKKENHG